MSLTSCGRAWNTVRLFLTNVALGLALNLVPKQTAHARLLAALIETYLTMDVEDVVQYADAQHARVQAMIQTHERSNRG